MLLIKHLRIQNLRVLITYTKRVLHNHQIKQLLLTVLHIWNDLNLLIYSNNSRLAV